MTAHEKTLILRLRLHAAGIPASYTQAETLRRAELALHRWAEGECGDGNDYASWCLERDEETGKTYRVTYPHRGSSYRTRVPDRETGALRRAAAVCAALGITYHHQTDPRGCALYVGPNLTDSDYTRGVPCCP